MSTEDIETNLRTYNENRKLPLWIYDSSKILDVEDRDILPFSTLDFPIMDEPYVNNEEDYFLMIKHVLFFDIRPIHESFFRYSWKNKSLLSRIQKMKSSEMEDKAAFYDMLIHIVNAGNNIEHPILCYEYIPESFYHIVFCDMYDTCSISCKHNCFAIIDWCVANGYVLKKGDFFHACNNKNTLMKLINYKKEKDWYKELYEGAAAYGNIELIEWIMNQNFNIVLGEKTLYEAAIGNHLDVVKWICEKGIPLYSDVTVGFSRSGNIEALEWCKLRGLVFSAQACANVCNMETLQWLRNNGCTCNLSYKGELEMIQWAIENGCPYNKEECIRMANRGEKKDIIAFFNSLP